MLENDSSEMFRLRFRVHMCQRRIRRLSDHSLSQSPVFTRYSLCSSKSARRTCGFSAHEPSRRLSVDHLRRGWLQSTDGGIERSRKIWREGLQSQDNDLKIRVGGFNTTRVESRLDREMWRSQRLSEREGDLRIIPSRPLVPSSAARVEMTSVQSTFAVDGKAY